MSSPHAIRLRGPWQYEPLARTVLLPDGTTEPEPGELPPPGRIIIPSDWGETLGADFRGRVKFLRRFNRPTGLDPLHRVFIVIEQIDAFGCVSLNEASLGEIPAVASQTQFEITKLIQPHNILCIEVELPRTSPESDLSHRRDQNQPGGIIGEVRLEIDE